ncbi:M20 family metallopeptidase [Brevibacillus sp. SIMBA_040]|uniref:M20 family metallopeptidase n=2 Tax=Bacteria TaxID=2 RepID=UPI00397B8786
MERIAEWFTEAEVVTLTQEMIRIPSDWNQPLREKHVLDYICRFLDKHGIEYRISPVEDQRYNIIATYRGQDPVNGKSLLLNGHVDTVPAYEMEFAPFEGFLEGGYIHGRGAVDMKGAVAAMIMALVVCKRANIALAGDLIFTAVVGEEGRSEGTESLVLQGFKADGAIVGEPSNFDFAIGHRGLEWIELIVHGKIAHSGVAEQGINAIRNATKLITALDAELGPKLQERFNPYTGPSILNYGRIEGGTQPSTVADKCKIQIDRRYLPGETLDQVTVEIQAVIDQLAAEDPEFRAELTFMEENAMTKLAHVPMMTDPSDEVVSTLTKSITNVTGRTPTMSTRRGWTDGGLLSHYLGIPTVICGPGDISYSHAKNERIAVEQLVQAVEIYVQTAVRFCGMVK